MDKIDNAIESAYRALAENLSKDNILLYSEVPDPKLQIVFSTLHTTINWTCERMNERLPTGNSTAHFWAEESRQLLNAIGTVEQLHKSLQGSRFAFFIDAAYQTSVYKGYKQDKIEMRGDRAEMSDFPLYLNTVAGGLDRRDQTIGGFSFVVKIYAVPVVEIIG